VTSDRLIDRGHQGPRSACFEMFYVAKLIEALGVVYVSYALFVGFTEEHSMGSELKLMMIGAAIFLVGRLLERRASA
jgi:hypothetical protein